MNKLNDFTLLLFRVTIGSFMLFGHGLGKFTKLVSGNEIQFFDPFGIGSLFSFILIILAEFLAASFIILGVFTRLNALLLIAAMTVAGLIYHFDDPFSSKEKALMYLVSFIFLFLAGPGKYSLQKFLPDKLTHQKNPWKFILS